MRKKSSPRSLQGSDFAGRVRESIPVYVITGFLDAGKTTFLNEALRRRVAEGCSVCCLQFEQGEQSLSAAGAEIDSLSFPMRQMQADLNSAKKQLCKYLLDTNPDEVWIEWNGMLPLERLQALFSPGDTDAAPGDFCKIRKVLHIADAPELERLLNGAGNTVMEQLAGADLIVLRGCPAKPAFRRLKRMLRELNPGVKVLADQASERIMAETNRKNRSANLSFFLAAAGLVLLYFLLRSEPGLWGSSPDTVINVFLGILLQAVPFLLIGVLISSFLQIFVSRDFIEKWFPKNLAGGMLFAVLAGFCLPVCDCASIPVFRSLVRKGVPMASAVTFMLATPVINPVVILSTWYAFGGNLPVVLGRIGLGILCAVLIGLTFIRTKGGEADRTGGRLSDSLCACGCYDGKLPSGFWGKFTVYMRHAQSEFFSVGKYLLIGAFVSALFQTLGSGLPWKNGTSGLLLPLLLMMLMAFLLSLCSSSDAVVARSFAGQFPMGALMGFLVFGPMMDIKNIILLSGGFSKRFILRLCLTTFLVCASVVFLAFHLGLERILL